MSAGKSEGIHSGPYGAAVMTSLSWFSTKRDPSRKFMSLSVCRWGRCSERRVADDAGAFHLPVARRVVHHRVMLGAAVVPHGHRVRLPAPAHLVFGDLRLAEQVLQELARAGGVVLADAHALGRVEVREVGGEGVD